MMFFKNKKIIFVILLVILFIGFAIRKHNLYTWPRLGATFDEYAWTWQGMNLILKGVPISWSPHSQYKNKKLVIYQKTAFWIAKPFLEHPPFFGLVAGEFAILKGAKNMFQVDLKTIRPLALILGVFAIFMVFLLSAELYGVKIGLLSSFIYSILPTVVIGSRIVQNENFFIPFWLLSLYLIVKYIKIKKNIFRSSSAVLCGILSLAKVPWLAAAFSIVLIFLFLKKYKDIYKFLIIVIPIFLLYFVYGFYYDSHLFLSLWTFQLNRYDLTFTSIYALLQKPYLVDRFYTDGWIYFGWFSLILISVKDFKKNIFIMLPFLAYFLVFLLAIPDEPSHGWYRYPFYPFMTISIALFLKEYFTRNWLLTFLFLIVVGLPLFQLTWIPTFGFSYIIFRFVLFGISLSLIPQFFQFKKATGFSTFISYGWLILFFLMSAWSVLIYNEF